MFKRIDPYLFTGIILLVLLSSCLPENSTQLPPVEKATFTNEPNGMVDLIPVGTDPSPSILQSTLPPPSYGPEQADFPAGVNPFTGLPVADPTLLEQPALLVSITHFPPDVRPQAGLSFAPWVFEYLIATGTTRFAAVFHGQIPFPEAPLIGSCEVRVEPFQQEGILLGNRVWLDKNADGFQSPEEPGAGGVCVNLYNGDGDLIQETSSDSNGYYAFNVDPGTYVVEFVKPEGWEFTEPNLGYENSDSDAAQTTGRTNAVRVEADVRLWDAGLLPLPAPGRMQGRLP